MADSFKDRFMDFARRTYDGLRRLPELPAATFHPWRLESKRKLAALKDSHKGERCFVVGNGPSLKNTDLSKLKDDFSIGMNRIFLAADELNFTPDILVCVNDLVVEQSVKEFSRCKSQVFAWRARKWLSMDPGCIFIHFLHLSKVFKGRPRQSLGRCNRN